MIRSPLVENELQEFLSPHGLILGIIHVGDLTDSLRSSTAQAVPSITDQHSLLLFANAGPTFWRSMSAENLQHDNPVDNYSKELLNDFARTFIQGDYAQLYPGHLPISLIGLGTHVGWSHPSPLGLTLHHKYGPWYAFRFLIQCKTEHLNQSLQTPTIPENAPPPCESCNTKPCVAECPVGAVSATEPFNIIRCFSHRQAEGSACESDCPARRACPVGEENAYDQAQLKHHMLRSLNRRSH